METKEVQLALMRRVVEAILPFFETKVAHGDLKLENMLIDDDIKIYLCDFGSSEPYCSFQINKIFTKEYAAPELLNIRSSKARINI